MAIRMKDIGSLSQKFVQRAGAATNDYVDGVSNAGPDWEQRTKAAAGTWKQAVTEAAGSDRFERGVSDAGAVKFSTRAKTLGGQRYAPGVQQAAPDWAKGFAPYHQALQGMDLPPRSPRGSPQNAQISQAVQMRLAAIKKGKAA
jgi:hypothetical protein